MRRFPVWRGDHMCVIVHNRKECAGSPRHSTPMHPIIARRAGGRRAVLTGSAVSLRYSFPLCAAQ
jgi:hypothetical protein